METIKKEHDTVFLNNNKTRSSLKMNQIKQRKMKNICLEINYSIEGLNSILDKAEQIINESENHFKEIIQNTRP